VLKGALVIQGMMEEIIPRNVIPMRHHGSIAGVEFESDCDFIVYGPGRGLVAECRDLSDAKKALRRKLSEANERNCFSDLAVFRWSNDKWTPAVSPYDIQEWELQSDPWRIVRFP
jgi:hypothetical protein